MSVSEKQLEANRRNALRSCGPRSEAGKAIVARNATSHGLCGRHAVIDGESREEFDLLHEEMTADLRPVGMLENCLADKIISSIWRQLRAKRIEGEVIDTLRKPAEEKAGKKNQLPFVVKITKTYTGMPEGYEEPDDEEQPKASLPSSEDSSGEQEDDSDKAEKLSLGRAVLNDIEGSNILQKLQRYINEIDNGLYKAIKEFYNLQEKRAKNRIIDAEISE